SATSVTTSQRLMRGSARLAADGVGVLARDGEVFRGLTSTREGGCEHAFDNNTHACVPRLNWPKCVMPPLCVIRPTIVPLEFRSTGYFGPTKVASRQRAWRADVRETNRMNGL